MSANVSEEFEEFAMTVMNVLGLRPPQDIHGIE